MSRAGRPSAAVTDLSQSRHIITVSLSDKTERHLKFRPFSMIGPRIGPAIIGSVVRTCPSTLYCSANATHKQLSANVCALAAAVKLVSLELTEGGRDADRNASSSIAWANPVPWHVSRSSSSVDFGTPTLMWGDCGTRPPRRLSFSLTLAGGLSLCPCPVGSGAAPVNCKGVH